MKKEKSSQEKKCWNCGKYRAYYTKGYKGFNKEKEGLCIKHDKAVLSQDNCEFWQTNIILRRISKIITLKELTNLAGNICEITQILRDEQEENKHNPINRRIF